MVLFISKVFLVKIDFSAVNRFLRNILLLVVNIIIIIVVDNTTIIKDL